MASKMMTKSRNISLEDFLASLPGRTVLAITTAVVLAGVLPLFFYFFPVKSKIGVSIVLLTVLSLVSGFSSRIFLRGSTRILKILTSLVSLTVGMLILGFLTSGLVEFTLSSEKSLMAGMDPSSVGIYQYFFSAILTILFVLAWSGPSVRIKTQPIRHEKNRVRELRTKNTPSRLVTDKFNHLRQIISDIRVKSSLSKLKEEGRARFHLVSDRIRNGLSKYPQLNPKRKKIRLDHNRTSPLMTYKNLRVQKRRDSIKLVGNEVHNCPYCLELVSKKDPRGRKICSICKTWHHADCWEAGGECQVPHRH